ncbi:MAG TPA: AAA family ATPase [Planctomycetes bacterium]|nr:AAA family ATPase [Planctomycetota bacterium]
MTRTTPTPGDTASSSPEALEERLAEIRRNVTGLREEIAATFLGHSNALDLLLQTLFAGGHALLEGAPGLGKTTLVKAAARSLDLDFQRIQFTPDLMPADILGARILEETPGGGHSFRFEKGPLFTQVVLADEINRATPRTQSALLEAMGERQITIYGESFHLAEPFFVIGTQNPIEMEGTYPLPEAQLDRFLCRIDLENPSQSDLERILSHTTGSQAAEIHATLCRDDVLAIRALVREIPASNEVITRVARLIRATDPRNPDAPERVRRLLRCGASPRGGQAVLLLAKARALIAGRPFVSDEDLDAVVRPALRHRLVLGYEAEATGLHPDELVDEAWEAARE